MCYGRLKSAVPAAFIIISRIGMADPAPRDYPRYHSGRLEGTKAVTSNLRPSKGHIDPAYERARVPRELPRIYLVGTMRAVAPGGASRLRIGGKRRSESNH
jgi:hypothetical protein